jgi:hypothetical protein
VGWPAADRQRPVIDWINTGLPSAKTRAAPAGHVAAVQAWLGDSAQFCTVHVAPTVSTGTPPMRHRHTANEHA